MSDDADETPSPVAANRPLGRPNRKLGVATSGECDALKAAFAALNQWSELPEKGRAAAARARTTRGAEWTVSYFVPHPGDFR
jgi:hypothetical protein